MATLSTVYVVSRRLRLGGRRHPWVYADHVERVEGDYSNGDAVVVRASEGKFLAHGLINDRSKLRLRLLSFDKKRAINDELLKERVRDAVALRATLGLPARTNAYRVVHSEGDGLPGLIVDRYDDVLVLTTSVLGVHQRLDPILDELQAQLKPRAIVERGVSEGLRKIEGLPPGRGVIRGSLEEDETVEVTIDRMRFAVRVAGDAQKTGLFLDQRENVRDFAALCAGKRVLDVCCYAGAFSIAAAKKGAARVEAFDSSAEAVAIAQHNAALNGVGERIDVRKASLYTELRRLADANETFDRIVLDPPKFAPTSRSVRKATKGYLDANLMALRLLRPGGLLLTCSCSGHISVEDFEGILRQASARSNSNLRVLSQTGAGADHPVDAQCPEGRYLKAFLIQKRPS